MGWGEAHTNPEKDVAALEAELEGCRREIGRLRHDRHQLLDLIASLIDCVPDRERAPILAALASQAAS